MCDELKFLFLSLALLANVSAKSTGRIFGGQKAESGQFPYIATIISTSDLSYTLCDATILNEEWILSSGYCVAPFIEAIPEDVRIGVGSTTLSANFTYSTIRQAILHPNYDTTLIAADIGLLRLTSPLNFTDLVQGITLGSVDVDESVTIAGWGGTETDTFPDDLVYLETKTISVEDCKELLEGRATIDETKICTLTQEGEGICFGDAGGPLVLDGVLVGIISAGIPCGQGLPDIHTRIETYEDWIRAITGIGQK